MRSRRIRSCPARSTRSHHSSATAARTPRGFTLLLRLLAAHDLERLVMPVDLVELAAAHRSVEEMRERIGATSLSYLSLEGMQAATRVCSSQAAISSFGPRAAR